ncbi:ribonuclease P (30kD) [Cryptosporidium xiaoi]|uniref:Ribonuclease P (30kD) n=1 Tax=Cryptosporidium xiaoi TaxID=659607 RepID=A0AAV9XY70_9CRYT
MSFELCVNWPGDLDIGKELIKRAYSLGYKGIAFNHTLNLIDKCNQIKNHISKSGGRNLNLSSNGVLSSLAKEGHVCPIQYINIDRIELTDLRKKGIYNNTSLLAKNTYIPLNLSCHDPTINGKLNTSDDISLDFFQLRRITIVFDSQDHTPYINALSRGPCNESSDSWSKALFSNLPNKPYDIVAVRPTTQNSLNAAISSVECDIISIDISSQPKLPFIIKRQQINLAISRGIFFEIDIGKCFLNKGNHRRNFFLNFLTLTRHVPHKNIIITGSPSCIIDIKSPIDLSNICYVLLSMDLDRKINVNPNDFIDSNALRALAKGANRKTFASIIVISEKNDTNQGKDYEMNIL